MTPGDGDGERDRTCFDICIYTHHTHTYTYINQILEKAGLAFKTWFLASFCQKPGLSQQKHFLIKQLRLNP